MDYFCPMFDLTMRYLLDDQGLGHSFLDVKEVVHDMRGAKVVFAERWAWGTIP